MQIRSRHLAILCILEVARQANRIRATIMESAISQSTGALPQRRGSRALLATIILAALVAALWPVFAWSAPKRFAEVVPGRLYRSGTVAPAHLQRLQHSFGIRRVLSMLNPDAPESRAEQQACRALGIQYENVPLRGNGASTPADRERILALLQDPAAGPTLVHCAAGTNRTGLAIGLYRIHVQGWPLDRTMAELRAFDFLDEVKHGNLHEALRQAAEDTRGH